MDKWKLHFVLLIAVALLGRINADDFVDEDDEVTVETEQVVSNFSTHKHGKYIKRQCFNDLNHFRSIHKPQKKHLDPTFSTNHQKSTLASFIISRTSINKVHSINGSCPKRKRQLPMLKANMMANGRSKHLEKKFCEAI